MGSVLVDSKRGQVVERFTTGIALAGTHARLHVARVLVSHGVSINVPSWQTSCHNEDSQVVTHPCGSNYGALDHLTT